MNSRLHIELQGSHVKPAGFQTEPVGSHIEPSGFQIEHAGFPIEPDGLQIELACSAAQEEIQLASWLAWFGGRVLLILLILLIFLNILTVEILFLAVFYKQYLTKLSHVYPF